MFELLSFVLCIMLLSYLGGLAVGGTIKANSILSWEWKQVKKFFKWVFGLMSKLFLAIQKSIKV